MIPNSRETFKEHCLRRLGAPVIHINVDDDQVEDRIDEALNYWQEFHSDATTRIYLQHPVTATDISNKYITANNDVIHVNKVFPATGSSGGGNINMFDYRYQMRLNDWTTFYSAKENLDYYLIMRQLEQIDMLYQGTPGITWSRHMNRIYIHWEWGVDILEGEYIIIECQVAVDSETFTSIWQDRMLQKYASALIRRQWGMNTKKFSGTQLLGGVEIAGQQIYDEAVQEIQELELKIREEFEEPPIFITG